MSQQVLGVAVVGPGWCGNQHIEAFRANPHAEVRAVVGASVERARRGMQRHGVEVGDADICDDYKSVLLRDDIAIVVVASPNDLHAEQAVAAARAGKHLLLEKPMGMNAEEVESIVEAVAGAGVRSIVSFELRFNPYLRYVKWLTESGLLGDVRFVRVQYLSRVTDWYSGWDWVRTRRHGGSHLVAAGVHAMDTMRWLAGQDLVTVSALHTSFTEGYEFPTTIEVNLLGDHGALAHVTSSTDFPMPYAFQVEVMGSRLCVRDDVIAWLGDPPDLDGLVDGAPPGVSLAWEEQPSGRRIRIHAKRPDSVDVGAHPFGSQAEELVAAIQEGRPTSMEVGEAAKSMKLCFAADRSADLGGQPMVLPSGN